MSKPTSCLIYRQSPWPGGWLRTILAADGLTRKPGESLYPDFNNPKHGLQWDYTRRGTNEDYRIYLDGKIEHNDAKVQT